MPSQRKRIGFLPSEEVHNIIDKICIENKYSQSKVTGILVEEALKSRGVLKNELYSKHLSLNNVLKGSNDINNIEINKDLGINSDSLIANKSNSAEDYEMINEFIEYKFFKKVMFQNRDKYKY